VFLLRARVEPDEESPAGGFRVASPGEQDSSFLASLASANAIVFLPAERGEVREGDVMPAIWLGGRP
jgi:molybdopterin biosynthesis enzyme